MTQLWMNDGSLVMETGSVVLCDDCPCEETSSSSSGEETSSSSSGVEEVEPAGCVANCRDLIPVTLFADIAHEGAGPHDIDEQTVELTLITNGANNLYYRGFIDCPGDTLQLNLQIQNGPSALGQCDDNSSTFDCLLRMEWRHPDGAGPGQDEHPSWLICDDGGTTITHSEEDAFTFSTNSQDPSCDPLLLEFYQIDIAGDLTVACCDDDPCASQEYSVVITEP